MVRAFLATVLAVGVSATVVFLLPPQFSTDSPWSGTADSRLFQNWRRLRGAQEGEAGKGDAVHAQPQALEARVDALKLELSRFRETETGVRSSSSTMLSTTTTRSDHWSSLPRGQERAQTQPVMNVTTGPQCHLLAGGILKYSMQVVLGCTMLLIVMFRWMYIEKKQRAVQEQAEAKPEDNQIIRSRDFQVFVWDSMKQLVGNLWIHVLNVFLEPEQQQCEAYFLNIFLDSTVGTLLLYCFLGWTKSVLRRPGHRGYILEHVANFGNYKGRGTEMLWSIWREQTLVWLLLVTLMKFILIFVTTLCERNGHALEKAHELLMLLMDLASHVVSLNNPSGWLFLVMIFIPTLCNAFQFCVIDLIIQEREADVAVDSRDDETVTVYLQKRKDGHEVLQARAGKYVADNSSLQDDGPGLTYFADADAQKDTGIVLFWGSEVTGSEEAGGRVKCVVGLEEALTLPDGIGERDEFVEWCGQHERAAAYGLSDRMLEAYYDWMRVPAERPKEHVLKCLHIQQVLVDVWNKRLSQGRGTVCHKKFKEVCADSPSICDLFRVGQVAAALQPRRGSFRSMAEKGARGARARQNAAFILFRSAIRQNGPADFADVLTFMLQDTPDELWRRIYAYKMAEGTAHEGQAESLAGAGQSNESRSRHIPRWGYHELPPWAYDQQVGEFYSRFVEKQKASRVGSILLAKSDFQTCDGLSITNESAGEVMEITDDEARYALIKFDAVANPVWVSASDLEDRLETPEPTDCEWMFADVNCIAPWNPWRWSGPLLPEVAIAQLQDACKRSDRPIYVKVPANTGGAIQTQNIAEAIQYLEQKASGKTRSAQERLCDCIQNVEAHLRDKEGHPRSSEPSASGDSVCADLQTETWRRDLEHVLSGGAPALPTSTFLGNGSQVAQDLVQKLELLSFEHGDWTAVLAKLKHAKADLELREVSQVPHLSDCVGPAIESHAKTAIITSFAAMVFMPFGAIGTMTCKKEGGFADHVASGDLALDIIWLAAFVCYLLHLQHEIMKYAILSLLGATKDFVLDLQILRIDFCKYPYRIFLAFFYLMSTFNMLNLWTSAEVLGRVITTEHSCEEASHKITQLWEQVNADSALSWALGQKVDFGTGVWILYTLTFAQPLCACLYAVPRCFCLHQKTDDEVTYDVGEEEEETGARKHTNYRTAVQGRPTAGASHHGVLQVLATLTSFDAVHFQDLTYGVKMTKLYLKEAGDAVRKVQALHSDDKVEKSEAPSRSMCNALDVHEQHCQLCAELACKIKKYYQSLLIQLQRSIVKLVVIGFLQNAVQTKVQLTILSLNTSVLGGTGPFTWKTWDLIDPLFFLGVVLNLVGFLFLLLDLAEICSFGYDQMTLADVWNQAPPPELCRDRRPVVGDRVRQIECKALIASDSGGSPCAWRLPAEGVASIAEVDEDGDFRLSRGDGRASAFLYRKYFQYANNEAARTRKTDGDQMNAFLMAPHVTFRPEVSADISYLQLCVGCHVFFLVMITIFLVLLFIYQATNFVMFFLCESRIWNVSWPWDPYRGCWDPHQATGI